VSRVAVLPTGERIEFPVETPDHEIHKAVRQRMGLPPPAGTSEQLVTQALQVMQQSHAELLGRLDDMTRILAQATHGVFGQEVASSNRHAVDTMGQLAVMLRDSASQSEQTGRQLADLASRVEGAAHKIHGAMTATKKAVKEKDGSWSTKIVEN
jgi:uncharacterized protein YdiU (UPF0061 family)